MADTEAVVDKVVAAAAAADEVGVFLSYAALGLMAVVPIYVGAKRSTSKEAPKPGEVWWSKNVFFDTKPH